MQVNEHTIIVKGLQKEYRFIQITDSHILLQDDDFDAKKKEVYKRRESILFTRNGTTPEVKLSSMMDYAKKNNLFPIFSGDILDYPSKANFAYFDKELSKVDDYFFVLGNHDWTYMDQYQGLIDYNDYRSEETFNKYYHLFDKYVKDGSLKAQKREFDDLVLLGIDTYDGEISEDEVDYFKKVIKLNKPIIIVAHIPYYEKDMQPVMDAFAPGYLTKVCFGQEKLPMGKNEKRFKELMLDPNNKVIAYLAGHCHCTMNTKIDGLIPQFVLGGSYEDEVNVFIIKPGE